MDANLLHEILISCQSPVLDVRKLGEEKVNQIIKQTPLQFILLVQQLLYDRKSNQSVLFLSSIIFKNAMANEKFSQAWLSLSEDLQTKMEEICTELLMNENHDKRKCSSIMISSILVCNLPKSKSHNLMKELLKLTLNEKEEARMASLECLSIAIEESDSSALVGFTDGILNSVIQVIMHDTSSKCICWAFKGLLHSLKLCVLNFQKENERNIILDSVIKGLLSTIGEIKQNALLCASEVISMYYSTIDKIIEPLGHMLLGISAENIEENEINLQIIQVWIEICSKEKSLVKKKSSKGFIEAGYKFMTEKLLSILVKCDSDEDEDWNLRTACGCCLGYIAQVVGNSICEVVFANISNGLSHEALNQKVAALITLGSIIEGPEKTVIGTFIQNTFAQILKCLDPKNQHLCINSSWCLCRICEAIPEFIFASDNFEAFLSSVIPMLKCSPKICNTVCMSFYYLTNPKTISSNSITMLLEPKIFSQTVISLWEVALRSDSISTKFNLCNSSLLAIINLINISHSNQQFLIELTQKSIEFLGQSMTNTSLTKSIAEEYQAFFTSIMYNCLEKSKNLLQLNDALQILSVVFKIFEHRKEPYDEGFITISVIASIIGAEFEQSLPMLMPFIQAAFNNFNNLGDISIVRTACLCLNEVSRVLGAKFGQYLPEIITFLIKFLSNSNADREIKVISFESLGDLALNCPAQFLPCMDQSLKILAIAADLSLQPIKIDDEEEAEEELDYIDRLIGSMLDCLTSLVLCVKECHSVAPIEPYINGFIKYCTEIGKTYGTKSRLSWKERFKQSLGIIADLSLIVSIKPKAMAENAEIITLMINTWKSDMTADETDEVKYIEEALSLKM